MSWKTPEINDDEIRVITSSKPESAGKNSNRKHMLRWILVAVIAVVAIAALLVWFLTRDDNSKMSGEDASLPADTITISKSEPVVVTDDTDKVLVKDTMVNGSALILLTPVDLMPRLQVSSELPNDPAAKMVFPAADVRDDNGGIVGAFVLNGELISKGQSKSGFCAIMNGHIEIGVADTTPMLEQAIEGNGSFFRQYPLVADGRIVDNKPKGRAYRKALAEINGNIMVVLSKDRLTFHDFSQRLVDLGATTAIYLVGGEQYGYIRNEAGERIGFGNPDCGTPNNASFIVWR